MSSLLHVTFLRHGRSGGDDEGVHEGRYDAPLTAVGREQAQRRAEQLKQSGLTFERIIASPLQRARQTAETLGAYLALPLEVDPDWMEMDNGPLAGLPFDVAAARFPKPAFRNPYEPFCETGESDWELHCRAARAVEKVVRRGPGRYLIVAHGGILNAALRTIVGAGPAFNGYGIWFALADTGYVRATYNPLKHYWALHELQQGFE